MLLLLGTKPPVISDPRYWVYALDDALDIIAKIPTIAAKIYRRTFQDGVVPEWLDLTRWRLSGGNDAFWGLEWRF